MTLRLHLTMGLPFRKTNYHYSYLALKDKSFVTFSYMIVVINLIFDTWEKQSHKMSSSTGNDLERESFKKHTDPPRL
jgi:hypothetical protein